MTTKPTIKRFHVRRRKADDTAADTPAQSAPAAEETPATAPTHAAQIDAISKEGLTARQLRLARRVALKNGFEASSDYDAVRQLRAAGIDPFQRSSVVDLVTPDKAPKPGKKMRIQLPDTRNGGISLPAQASDSAAERNASEIRQIQREIARRRRRKLVLLFTRLSVFIFLPTFLVGWYFYNLATPMYATSSEIVIQQAQPQGGAGGGGLATLFQGTSMATQQDSIAVQSYLASREAMLRLDADHGFKEHFKAVPAFIESKGIHSGLFF